MDGGEAMIVAGLGFRTTCTADELVALIVSVRDAAGAKIAALAVPDFKAGASALAGAASSLALEVRPVSRQALIAVQPLCPSRSAAALAAVDLASVAEACALAAAGPGARLVSRKTASKAATCALAASASEEELGL
jgi:cobalt-precorrin 5A hydrolase